MIKIAIVAGEASGDILGSRLIKALKALDSEIEFEGVAGVEMMAEGCSVIYPMERLAVMGFIEVLPRLPELLTIRKNLVQHWLENPPDLMIGIDAPDFNLALEARLHQQNIPTIHYVSPSIWAWRESRVKKIKGNVDRVLTLFPFEVDFYKKHQIPATFVGHPLADEIPLQPDRAEARATLHLDQGARILAVLPGSRSGEIKRLAPDFLMGLKRLYQRHPDWQFVVPLINADVRQQFEALHQELAVALPLTLVDGQSRVVMTAADQVLLASGTAVLEGMLINRSMVAAYRVAPLTAFIIRTFKMIKSNYFTLPNNLCDEALVPELIQEEVTPENIEQAIEAQFQREQSKCNYEKQRFHEMHIALRQNASQRAADAVLALIQRSK